MGTHVQFAARRERGAVQHCDRAHRDFADKRRFARLLQSRAHEALVIRVGKIHFRSTLTRSTHVV